MHVKVLRAAGYTHNAVSSPCPFVLYTIESQNCIVQMASSPVTVEAHGLSMLPFPERRDQAPGLRLPRPVMKTHLLKGSAPYGSVR